MLHNLEHLDIQPGSIMAVAVSHDHWDHLGGLPALLRSVPGITVYLPGSFSKRIKAEVRARAKLVEVEKPTALIGGILTTGELGVNIKEQSLLVPTMGGNLLVTGCAHPGLATIIRAARRQGPLRGVIGGFHGFDQFKALEGLDPVVPCHCTQHGYRIRRRYPGQACGVGRVIELPDPEGAEGAVAP